MIEWHSGFQTYTSVINSAHVGLIHVRLAAELVIAEVRISAWTLNHRNRPSSGDPLDVLEPWDRAKTACEEFWQEFEASSPEWRNAKGRSRLEELLGHTLEVIRNLVPAAADYWPEE